MLIKITEKLQSPFVIRFHLATFTSPMEARNKVIHKFGSRGVITNNDEYRRRCNSFLFPAFKNLNIMPIKRVQRRLQLRRQAQRIERFTRFAAPLLGHFGANVFPKITEFGHITAGNVVRNRHTGQLDNAAFNRIHQRKIACHPRKKRPLYITRPTQKEGRG